MDQLRLKAQQVKEALARRTAFDAHASPVTSAVPSCGSKRAREEDGALYTDLDVAAKYRLTPQQHQQLLDDLKML